jgi:3-hydroxyisobutyrate dehydrogenase
MKIGWIGLGNMGNPMSQRLIKAGYEVQVYNRTKEKEEHFK